MITIGIDPGVRYCGIAVLDATGVLKAAALITDNDKGALWLASNVFNWTIANGAIDTVRLVAELPRVYAAGRQKGDQNDLIALAYSLGACVRAIADVFSPMNVQLQTIAPRDWKGTIDGDVMLKRIEERLSAPERARIPALPASDRHNVVDAIGIALWGAGRLERKRVYG